MKITQSNQTINPFGGLNFVLDELKSLGVDKIIDQHFPTLTSQSQYSYSDVFLSLWSIFFCGGDCAEDLQHNLRPYLKKTPFINVPSSDTLLRRLKALHHPIKQTQSQYKVVHQFNPNHDLNQVNVKILKHLNLLSTKQSYTLDYDNVIIPNKKKDARTCYKHYKAYHPGVGIIGNRMVYLENRNGNSNPEYRQEKTLERMFEVLNQQNITIDKFRADSGSFSFSVIDEVQKHCKHFYVKARLRSSILKGIALIDKWDQLKLPKEQVEVASCAITPFLNDKKKRKLKSPPTYRLIVKRIPRKDGQLDIFTKQAYSYISILTNDTKSTPEQIFLFYNQRGKQEREFDVMKNDFGWKNLPFSFMEQNTVFMIVMMICRNIFEYLICLFSQRSKRLKAHYRLKKFIFRFITIPTKWIRSSRRDQLKVYRQSIYT